MSASHAIWFELTLTGGLGSETAEFDKRASPGFPDEDKARLYALRKNRVKVMRHTSARIFKSF